MKWHEGIAPTLPVRRQQGWRIDERVDAAPPTRASQH
jgi:hypothetical protein